MVDLESVHPPKEKIGQERTKAFHKCVTHGTHGQPILHHIGARLAIFASAEGNLMKLN